MNLSDLCAKNSSNDKCFRIICPDTCNISHIGRNRILYMKDNYFLTYETTTYDINLYKTSTSTDVNSITDTLLDTYNTPLSFICRLNSNEFVVHDISNTKLHFFSIASDTINLITSVNVTTQFSIPILNYSFDSPASYERDTFVCTSYLSGGDDPPYRFQRVVVNFDGSTATLTYESDYIESNYNMAPVLYEYKPGLYVTQSRHNSPTYTNDYCSSSDVFNSLPAGIAITTICPSYTNHDFGYIYKNRNILGSNNYSTGDGTFHYSKIIEFNNGNDISNIIKNNIVYDTMIRYCFFNNYSDSTTEPIYITPYDLEGQIYSNVANENPFLYKYHPIRANYGFIHGIGFVKLERI